MNFLKRAAVGALAVSAAVLLTAAPAAAAPSEQDQAWMVAAHQSNLAEIAAGTAAQENAVSEDVREMAAMLIADHQALDADLTAAAQQFGVQLPGEPSAEQQATLQQVLTNQGEAFDAAWIAAQIDGHRASLAAGQQEIASGSDPAAIALAQAAAPVVQGHLDHLLGLAGQVPGLVPSGTSAPETPALLGVSLAAMGLVAVAAALVMVRRTRSRV